MFQSSGIPEGENRINGEGNNSIIKIQEHVSEMKETSVQIKKTQTKIPGCEISLSWGQKKKKTKLFSFQKENQTLYTE